MKYDINLIGKKQQNVFDKALYFFLNYLRYILVITQLVVIGVLFFRFRIDQNIIDLKDSIDQKKEIVTAVKPIINESKKVDNQFTSIKKIIKNQETFSKKLAYITSIFPQTIVSKNFDISTDEVIIDATAQDPKHLQLFVARIKKDRKFLSADLTNVKKDAFGYSFSLTLKNFTQ